MAAIAGPPIPYVVQLTEPGLSGDPSKWAVIGHACTAPDGSTADPGIRMKELVDSFPENGTFQSACRGSLLPALQRIAEEVGKKMAPSCLGNILDTNPGLAGTQPECTVVDHYGNNAVRSDVVRRHCDSTHDVEPCWDLEAPTAPCPSGPVVLRGGPPPRSTTFVCKVCAKGDTRPGCLYGR